jgi:chromosome segregation ATPase
VTIQTTEDTVLARLEQKLDGLQKDLTELGTDVRVGQAKIEGKIENLDSRLKTVETSIQKIPELAEKVGELKNWKQIGLIIATAMISSIFSGTIGGVIGWLIKFIRSNWLSFNAK